MKAEIHTKRIKIFKKLNDFFLKLLKPP